MKRTTFLKTIVLAAAILGGVSYVKATDYGTTALTSAKTWNFNNAGYMGQLETNVFGSTVKETKLSTTQVYDNLFYGTNLYKAQDGWFGGYTYALGFSGTDVSESPNTDNVLALKLPVGIGKLSVTYSTGNSSTNLLCKVGSADALTGGPNKGAPGTKEFSIFAFDESDVLLYFSGSNGSNRIYTITWTPLSPLTSTKTWNFADMETDLTANVFKAENLNAKNELAQSMVYDNLFIGQWAVRTGWSGSVNAEIGFAGAYASNLGLNHLAFFVPASGTLDLIIWGYRSEKYSVKVGSSQVLDKNAVTNSGNGQKENMSFNISVTKPTPLLLYADKTTAKFLQIKYTPTSQNISAVDALGYTFSSKLPLNFTGKNVEAYTAAYNSTTKKVELSRVYKVPANTGLFIKGSADDIPVLTGDADAMGTNNLIAVSATTTVNQTAGDNTNFVLGVDNASAPTAAVFLKAPTAGVSVSAGKAYLQIPTASVPATARMAVVFNDETTGISHIENGALRMDNSVYNLSGQRVSQPKKGLYIVNGKKVIIK